MYNISKKKIGSDLILNVLASFVLTGVIQICVYPIISNSIGVIEFGSVLTIIGISNALANTFGTSLNNVHLLNQENCIEGKSDCKIIFKYSLIFVVLIMTLTIKLYTNIDIINIILINIICIFTTLRSYLGVYYRIELNYKLILMNAIFTGIGYLIGIGIFIFINVWTIIFLIGEIFSFIFFYKTTRFKSEVAEKTRNYVYIKKEYIQLLSANSISNILVYLDRLLINPILGSANVSIYFISSFVGKTLALVLQPLSSIILSYIAKLKNINPKKIFISMIITIIVFGGIALIITIPITPIIIKMLYKNDFYEASKYFMIANLGAILMTLGSLLQPMSLKFAPLWWQTVIQVVYGTIYIFGGIVFMINYGLYGFCIIAAFANFIRLIMVVVVSYKYIYMKN